MAKQQFTDPFAESVRQCLQGAPGDRLIDLLEKTYINQPVFGMNADPYQAALRDGMRQLALRIKQAARPSN